MTGPRGDRTILLQRVDTALLHGEHQWSAEPSQNISFRQYVEEAIAPRPDMERFKRVATVKPQKARDNFSKLCSSKTLFPVPETLYCDRTFVRDVEEVYYLDAMDQYLKADSGEQELDPARIPLLRRPLNHRVFSAFSKRPRFFMELYDRMTYGLWIPRDAYESLEFSYADHVGTFPQVGTWMNSIVQPSGLPIPIPFAIYYFHTELTERQDLPDPKCSERLKRIRFCAKYEYLILFLIVWWNEAQYGCRLYRLSEQSISYLDKMCGNLPSLAAKPVQAIIEHMRSAARRECKFENWMVFSGNPLPSSTFFWAVKGTGDFNHARIPGKTFWQDLNLRKIRNEAEVARKDPYGSVLYRTLKGHEVNAVQGLSAVVCRQKWDTHGPLSVATLLYNLVDLYNVTQARLNTALSSNQVQYSTDKATQGYALESRYDYRNRDGYYQRKDIEDKRGYEWRQRDVLRFRDPYQDNIRQDAGKQPGPSVGDREDGPSGKHASRSTAPRIIPGNQTEPGNMARSIERHIQQSLTSAQPTGASNLRVLLLYME